MVPGLLGAAAVAVVAVVVFGSGPSSGGAGSRLSPRPVLGKADAPVVMDEFGDFQCPSCGAFARNVEPQLRAAYIDTGRVRLVWHDFPWKGDESRAAANAARCAGDQGRFWDYHDLLYRSQAGENQGGFSQDRLKAFGSQLGLASGAFEACVDSGSHRGAVDDDFSDVRAQGFNATPTFLVAGQRIVGAQPFAVFQMAIEAALPAQ